jgi:hypothetical protein
LFKAYCREDREVCRPDLPSFVYATYFLKGLDPAKTVSKTNRLTSSPVASGRLGFDLVSGPGSEYDLKKKGERRNHFSTLPDHRRWIRRD